MESTRAPAACTAAERAHSPGDAFTPFDGGRSTNDGTRTDTPHDRVGDDDAVPALHGTPP